MTCDYRTINKKDKRKQKQINKKQTSNKRICTGGIWNLINSDEELEQKLLS